MSYETAPATKLLATHCACCNRPLVDAVSVEIGIGPDCRARHGYNIEAEPTNRLAANAIVHRIAAGDKSNIAADCAKLAALGFTVLSTKLVGKVATVAITENNGLFSIKTPYSEALVAALRVVPGRRWNKDAKLNEFPMASKGEVYNLLKRFFNGKVGVGPKGVFIVGQAPVVVEEPMVNAQDLYDAELARLQIGVTQPDLEAEYLHQTGQL